MENASYIALSRQTALWRQLQMTSNNMANMNTIGYKGESPLFSEYLVDVPKEDSIQDQKIAFVQDFGTVRDFSEGPLKETANPLDVALHGEGFFVTENEEGQFYTRNGQFKLNAEGMLVNNQGDAVLSAAGQPFFIAPGENDINIAKNGTVSTENGILGRLSVVRFEEPQKLMKVAGSRFQAGEDMEPLDVQTPDVEQGMIEDSNVKSIREVTRLIDLQRAYGNVEQMIETEGERQKRAIRTLGSAARG